MKKLLFTIIIIFISISCSNLKKTSILSIIPISNEKTFWKDGSQYIQISEEDIDISISNKQSNYNTYIFNLIIKNLSNKPLNIFPDKFYYISDNNSEKNFAINPELIINQTINEINYTRYEIDSNFSISFDFNYNIIESDNSTYIFDSEETADELRKLREEQREYQRNKNKLDKLKDKYDFFVKNLLRRTTIKNNEEIGGMVYVKLEDISDSFTLYFPIEDNIFSIKYKVLLSK